MSERTIELILNANFGVSIGEDKEEELIRLLRKELSDLNLGDVKLARDLNVSPGAKGEPITSGAIILSLIASGGVATKLIEGLFGWLQRDNRRTLTIIKKTADGTEQKIELTGISPKEQAQALKIFLGV